MDSLAGSRAQNFDAIESAIRYGQQFQNSGNKNQVDLFSNGPEKNSLIKTPELKIVDDWEEKKSLQFEKEVLGLYVSGHPLLEHSEDLEEFTSVDFSDSLFLKKNDLVTVGGMITKITKKYDRHNRPMAFFEMDCIGGHVEVIAFSDCFGEYENAITSTCPPIQSISKNAIGLLCLSYFFVIFVIIPPTVTKSFFLRNKLSEKSTEVNSSKSSECSNKG
jgi:DNA polymerase-3 subunit alpha